MIERQPHVLLTREGHQKLQQELDYLSTVRREEVARLLHEALESTGDLLTDGILESARYDQALVEGRIQELKSILSGAQIIDEATLPRDRVALGSYVTIAESGRDGAVETYRVVGPVEADPLSGKISTESPLGRALMGRRVGDKVVVQAPDGEEAFHILAIYPPGVIDGKTPGEAAVVLDRDRRFDGADDQRLSGRAVAGPADG